MYYLANLKSGVGKRASAVILPGSAKDLTAAKKQVEKSFPPDEWRILDINEICEESYWFFKKFLDEYIRLSSKVRLNGMLEEEGL